MASLSDFVNVLPGVPIATALGVALPAESIPPLTGYVRLTTRTGPLSSLDLLLMGEAALDTARTAGGWSVIERPNKVAITSWTGGGPLRLNIPVTLNALNVSRGDIGPGWRRLLSYWRPEKGDAPPVLSVAGHVAGTNHKWVIDELDTADDTVRVGGRLLRQSAVIRLLQFVDVDLAAATVKKPRKAKLLLVVNAKEGDTLRKIAKRELGDARQWRRVRKVNTKLANKPDATIAKGTHVTIPPRKAAGENIDD